VAPVFLQPPGIGKRIPDASATNAPCSLHRKHQISMAFCLGGKQSEFPASTKSRQPCVRGAGSLWAPPCKAIPLFKGIRHRPEAEPVSGANKLSWAIAGRWIVDGKANCSDDRFQRV
jgi:hypothetical protein